MEQPAALPDRLVVVARFPDESTLDIFKDVHTVTPSHTRA
jgi:hypothetical protein